MENRSLRRGHRSWTMSTRTAPAPRSCFKETTVHMATPGRKSVNNDWRTNLLTVYDREHVTRRTLAIRWGRGAGIGPGRRIGRRRDATTARADFPVHALG